jgi:DNA-directed RNA polymerase subunit M/transcription elongation factor TFIIS
MLKINSCPKCKGDVTVDKDEHGQHEECLQCGYLRDLGRAVKAALKINSCPRCRGDVLRDNDGESWYKRCLQCGYLRDLERVV